ncbi:hypothetical protein [Burkholderia ubonensis]|uniref:hypothetical protein n=1 Tax=Burkholderia ubonensis TaxID=101571 RepID=UPI0012F84623|nr:hypothetical protein [Burkholderia ubonensis]
MVLFFTGGPMAVNGNTEQLAQMQKMHQESMMMQMASAKMNSEQSKTGAFTSFMKTAASGIKEAAGRM